MGSLSSALVCGHQFLSPSSENHRSGVSVLLTPQRRSQLGHLSDLASSSVFHGKYLVQSRRTSQLRQHMRSTVASGASGDQVVEGSEEAEPTILDSNGVASNGSSLSSGTPTPSPFAAGKISSKIAAKNVQSSGISKPVSPSSIKTAPSSKGNPSSTPATALPKSTSKPPSDPVSVPRPSVFKTPSAAKPSVSIKSKSLIDDGSQGAFPTGKVSPFAADRLKSQMSSPQSQYNRTSSGRTMINSGKQVLEAFKQGERDGKTTKFGQPIVPKNIFDDVRRTQEEIEADKFSFNLKPGDIFLIFSFLLIIGLMLGTAFLVWKVGAIHYNE